MDTATPPSAAGEVEISLRIVGLDAADAHTHAVLAEHFAYALLSEQAGVSTLTIFADGAIAVVESVRLAQQVAELLPSARVGGVSLDLVGVNQISHRVGVSERLTQRWTQKPGFPTPGGVAAGSATPVWVWARVVEWLWEARSIDTGERLPSAQLTADINDAISRL